MVPPVLPSTVKIRPGEWYVTQNQYDAAIQMLLHGPPQSVITRNSQVSKSTISRLYQHLRQTRMTNNRSKSGRPRDRMLTGLIDATHPSS